VGWWPRRPGTLSKRPNGSAFGLCNGKMMSEIVPQPPPDDLATEPSETVPRASLWRKWMMIGGIITLIVVVISLVTPVVISCPKKGFRAQALMNAKEIGAALLRFEEDYGYFPCAATAPKVQSNNPD